MGNNDVRADLRPNFNASVLMFDLDAQMTAQPSPCDHLARCTAAQAFGVTPVLPQVNRSNPKLI
jgi:hypothetical protein